MDTAFTVLPTGRVFVDGRAIAAVLPTGAPAPPGVDGAPLVATGGTLDPGLIERHNHPSYNALRLWQVPERYTNRDQGAGTPAYRRLISGPMSVLGRAAGYIEAIVRHAVCTCLLGGSRRPGGSRS